MLPGLQHLTAEEMEDLPAWEARYEAARPSCCGVCKLFTGRCLGDSQQHEDPFTDTLVRTLIPAVGDLYLKIDRQN